MPDALPVLSRRSFAIGAAALFPTATPARADLVGHWFSGAENLNDTSGFTAAGTHDGVAVGNVKQPTQIKEK